MCQCKEASDVNDDEICVPNECLPGFEKNDAGFCIYVGKFLVDLNLTEKQFKSKLKTF